MKIIVFQDYLRSGGTERHSILLASELSDLGHDCRLVTARPGGRLAPTVRCPHHALQPFDTGLDWFVPGLTRACLRSSPDIILCMGKTANCYAGWLQRRARSLSPTTRVVATLRAGDRLPELYYNSVRQASHIVTNSREASDQLVDGHGIPRASVSVIYNSLVFPEAPTERDQDKRKSLGAGPGSTVLLSVAMFRKSKNQAALLRLAAGFPRDWDWHLWFAGEGPELERCKALSRQLGLSERVRFLGFTADPGPLYRAADIAVHASREEALSNFLIEAQANGLPAVAFRALGIRECFIEGRTGWMLEHGDDDGFRAALARLACEGPEARADRAREARAYAREHFDRGRQVEAYVQLFTSLGRRPANTAH
jgi:glycosyltransferase involved in cell wall biosynthesis